MNRMMLILESQTIHRTRLNGNQIWHAYDFMTKLFSTDEKNGTSQIATYRFPDITARIRGIWRANILYTPCQNKMERSKT